MKGKTILGKKIKLSYLKLFNSFARNRFAFLKNT